MKVRLLSRDQDLTLLDELSGPQEELVTDLELGRLFEAMAGEDKLILQVARSVLMSGLDSVEEIAYRQDVLEDCLANSDVVRELFLLARQTLQEQRRIWGVSSQNPSSILSFATRQVEAFLGRLRDLRVLAERHGGDFSSEGFTKLFRTVVAELDDEYFAVAQSHLRQLRFRNGELISAGLGRDIGPTGLVLRSPETLTPRWRRRLGLGSRGSYAFEIAPRDDAGAQILSDLTGRGINLVANALAQSADHIATFFQLLHAELGFFVGCLNLRDRLASSENPLCRPVAHEKGSGVARSRGLYDVSLALRDGKAVVGNDLDADGKRLTVVTGANSGGKSTFLRSVGLAQLMMQCGMFAGAEHFEAAVRAPVRSHFIRGEDNSMEKGRLDEELSRMDAIVDELQPYGLVLFNESFAATNEREGSEIGAQIVRALLEAKIDVMFVTHQYAFAEYFFDQGSDAHLFLRADRATESGPTYKLVAATPLPTSFGIDLYYKLGGFHDEDRGLTALDGPAPTTEH